MKPLILTMIVVLCSLVGLTGSLQAREREPRWGPSTGHEVLRSDAENERRADRFAERRERMRALREEMMRAPPRPSPYREDEERRGPPDRPEFIRPPHSRESEMREGFRRLSPEERRQFRRQLHDAGRDVYHDQ